MTFMDSTPKINDAGENPFEADLHRSSGVRRFDAFVDRMSERLNPILVKEARQALKSRQFVVTFALLLACGWAWSLLGIALASPGIYHAPGGTFMLLGYYFVLAAPVLIVVPFSAFRSLASEREDGTFELLSITSLGSRQIVTGKLCSVILQMVVYYSALAPCIAFTYLLRGIDIFTIGFVLFYTFVISILLSTLGLVVATITRARHWQVVLSVLLLIGLLAATVIWSIAAVNIIGQGNNMPYQTLDFWTANLAVISFCISFGVMFVLVSAALISFASDNRSTNLRVVMMVQQVLWIGWMTYFWLRAEEDEVLLAFATFPALYWYSAALIFKGLVRIACQSVGSQMGNAGLLKLRWRLKYWRTLWRVAFSIELLLTPRHSTWLEFSSWTILRLIYAWRLGSWKRSDLRCVRLPTVKRHLNDSPRRLQMSC